MELNKLAENFPEICLPQIPDNRISIEDYGAQKGPGVRNTHAFEKAVSDLEHLGGGVLNVPQGLWITGPIRFTSRMELHLERGALLVFDYSREEFPLIRTNYEGTERIRALSPLSAVGKEDIAITGEGIIDGSGEHWRMVKRSKLTASQWKQLVEGGGVEDDGHWFPSRSSYEGHHHPDIQPTEEEALLRAEEFYDFYRPVMVSFINCKRVLIEGVTLQNSPAWNVHPLFCEHVTVRNAVIRNPWYAQNGDGLDVESCRYVRVENSSFDVGDDAICLKSGKGRKARTLEYPTEYVWIEGCSVYHGHGGFVAGSEMSRGIRKVIVRNCTFLGTDVGIRFKSTLGRGGVVEDILLQGIRMLNIEKQAIVMTMGYAGGMAPEEAGPEDIPQFCSILMEDITCDGAAIALDIHGLKQLPIHDITLSHSVLTARKAMELEHAKNIRFVRVTIREDGTETEYEDKVLP